MRTRGAATGAGVLWNGGESGARGLVITNAHVVRGDRATIELSDGAVARARVVARDPKRDLALIEVEAIPPDVTAMKLAADSAEPGDRVHSVGNPGTSDALWIYTSGTVRQVYQKRYVMDGQQRIDGRWSWSITRRVVPKLTLAAGRNSSRLDLVELI